jgi:uncharacterized protein YndB with AHSA1/START domain
MSEFHSFVIAQEIELEATPDKVWNALTQDIDAWWAHRIGEGSTKVSLDARLGGVFEERWGDGEGAIWGEVVDLRRGQRLRLKGSLGMSGAGLNDYMYELEPNGSGTTLKLTHHALGYRDADTEKMYREGWKALLESCLPNWVHDGKRAERGA